jgi:hypothetical protein
MKSTRSLSILASLPILLGLLPAALRAQTTCFLQNGTMNGIYVISGSGTFGGSPFTLVGKVTYDGQGHGSITYSASVGGTIYRGITATGVYTVNADCTGSKTFTDSTGNTSHYDFVITPDGSKITWLETDSFTNVLGSALRLDHQN